MPRFRDEEHKQEWLAKCAATRLKNKKAKQAKPTEMANGFQDETTVGDIPRGHRVQHTKPSTGGILGAVEEIDSKIAALQQVRRSLIHAHELVTA